MCVFQDFDFGKDIVIMAGNDGDLGTHCKTSNFGLSEEDHKKTQISF